MDVNILLFQIIRCTETNLDIPPDLGLTDGFMLLFSFKTAVVKSSKAIIVQFKDNHIKCQTLN